MSWKCLIVGLVLGVAGLSFLVWNEWRTMKTARTLAFGRKNTVEVDAARIDPANEGKLVRVTGIVQTDERFSDPLFGLEVNAIAFNRSVAMFQWEETEHRQTLRKKQGVPETRKSYTYRKTWLEKFRDPSSFHEKAGHEFPRSMPLTGFKAKAQNVKLGAFKLAKELIDQIKGEKPLDVGVPVPTNIADKVKIEVALLDRPLHYTASKEADGFYLRVDENKIFKSLDGAPNLGDLRIRYTIIPPHSVTVVAMQKGNGLAPFSTPNGDTISMLYEGTLTTAQMFESEARTYTVMTWTIRACGLVMLFFCYYLLLLAFGRTFCWWR